MALSHQRRPQMLELPREILMDQKNVHTVIIDVPTPVPEGDGERIALSPIRPPSARKRQPDAVEHHQGAQHVADGHDCRTTHEALTQANAHVE